MKDDTISRQAALTALAEAMPSLTTPDGCGQFDHDIQVTDEAYVDCMRIIHDLPSAQPGCEDAVSRADVDILIEEAQTAWLRGDILLMYPALKKGLQKVPSVIPKQPGWIPVTERLPENDNDVLVTDGTDCAVAYWRTDAQAWDDCMHGWCDLYGLEVVAWMPLPTPYREGGQDNGTD